MDIQNRKSSIIPKKTSKQNLATVFLKLGNISEVTSIHLICTALNYKYKHLKLIHNLYKQQ